MADSKKISPLDRQKEIFLNGLAGIKSKVPADFHSLAAKAQNKMPEKSWAYIAGGAGAGTTISENQNAFSNVKILPRMLRNVSERDISVELLGEHHETPFFLSPIGVLELFHRDADYAVAKAAAKCNIPYIFSNQASVVMEKCAETMQGSTHWFQLYWSKSRELVQSFVQRAENCGCKAIVVTLDTNLLGWRPQDLNLAYLPFLEAKGIAQYIPDPVFQKISEEMEDDNTEKRKVTFQTLLSLIKMNRRYPGNFFSNLRSGKALRAVKTFINIFSNPALTWEDIPFLRGVTDLPILLKGIHHPEDVKIAIDEGIDGLIISNHGGRQVEGAASTLEMLPEIRKAAGDDYPLIFDSGIRGGADAFKAIALGANAVCIGRPYAYALALDGQKGVEDLIRNYLADFELTMALSGCKSINEINSDCIRFKN